MKIIIDQKALRAAERRQLISDLLFGAFLLFAGGVILFTALHSI